MDTTQLLWIVVCIALACLLTGAGIAAYAHFSNIPPPDSSLTKPLEVYADLIKATPIGCPNKDVLCDYYMASSGYTVIPGTTINTYIVADAITKVIKGGARLVEWDVYAVEGKPMIGLADATTQKMTTYNTLSVEECCIALGNAAFNSSVTPGYRNPFVLSLVFHTSDNAVVTQCADVLKTTVRKYMLGSEYSYQRKNLGVEPICNLMGKLIIVSGEHTKGNGMDELVNMSWVSSQMRRLTYNQATQTFDHEELIEFNKRNITLVVPDVNTTSISNRNAEICFSYGCQWVAMSWGSLDNAMELYTGTFAESSFAIKPELLRYHPTTYKDPKPQTPNVSLQPKQIKSPMYNYTIKSN
jgi:Phosphatidylinositol-specific phospholipase C, Y domain